MCRPYACATGMHEHKSTWDDTATLSFYQDHGMERARRSGMRKCFVPVALWSLVERLLPRSEGTWPHLRGDHAGTLPAYRPIGANCHDGTVFDSPIDAVLAITQPNRQRRKRPA